MPFISAYIVLSDLDVTPVNNRTSSSLLINFNVSEPWGTNSSYVLNYIVMVSNFDFEGSDDGRTLMTVDASRLLELLVRR